MLSDVAPEMLAIAEARGRAGVHARRIDFEAIDEPDGAYGVVREGLMFAVEPPRAAAEIRRVLRPGGRTAVAVWGPRERNPWLGALLDAVAAQIGEPLPPPGMPGPLALSDADGMRTMLEDAGREGVAVEERDVPLRARSPEAWWERGVALGGPVARRLAALPAEAVRAAREQACAVVGRYAGEGGLVIPRLTLLAHGRRA